MAFFVVCCAETSVTFIEIDYVIIGENEVRECHGFMITIEKAHNALSKLQDPFLHKSLEETGGIVEVKVKEEKNHVSVKVAIAKTNTPEQMQLQMKIVEVLKENMLVLWNGWNLVI